MAAVVSPNEEIAALYRSLAKPLEEIVRFDLLYAPRPVVEDACQFAWDRLIDNRSRVRSESALPWLARTAVRIGSKASGIRPMFTYATPRP